LALGKWRDFEAARPAMSKTSYTIQTFTMSASLAEDRIRLDTVDANGIFQAIWITRRLGNLMVPHIASHAEKQVASGLPKELVLSMNQEKLKAERTANPVPPVRAQPAITPWLARTVHFNQRPEGLIWTMTDDHSIDAHMILAGDNIRALLDVFLTSYRSLEWGAEAFPDWVIEAGAAKEVPVSRLN
jgi:hypothetical protein